MQLQIPDAVAQAIRLPEERLIHELLTELVALDAQRFLLFGKARELAGMGKYESGRLLGERRCVARHYSREELEDDLTYARGE